MNLAQSKPSAFIDPASRRDGLSVIEAARLGGMLILLALIFGGTIWIAKIAVPSTAPADESTFSGP